MAPTVPSTGTSFDNVSNFRGWVFSVRFGITAPYIVVNGKDLERRMRRLLYRSGSRESCEQSRCGEDRERKHSRNPYWNKWLNGNERLDEMFGRESKRTTRLLDLYIPLKWPSSLCSYKWKQLPTRFGFSCTLNVLILRKLRSAKWVLPTSRLS